MKKRVFALILALVFIVSAVGCKKNGGTDNKNNEPVTPVQSTDNKDTGNTGTTVPDTKPTEAPKPDDGKEKVGNLVYENGTVAITLDMTYMSVENQEQLDEVVAEQGFISGTVNDDNTVTIVMDRETHDEYVKEIEDNIKNALDSVVEDELYTVNITKAETNSDYTHFEIVTTEDELGFMDTLLGYTLLIYGEAYNIFMGISNPEVDVIFKSATTGGEITDMKDGLAMAEELFGSIFSGITTETVQFDEVDYPETVLVDNDVLTFTVKSISANGDWGYTLNTEIVNKSGKTLSISADKAAVNDWAINIWWGENVEAGETLESELYFSRSNLSECDITDVFVIEFSLVARDADDWFSDDLYVGEHVVYPHGVENSTIPAYEIPEEAYGLTLTDNFNIYLPEMSYDEFWETYEVKVYMENNCDKPLIFDFEDINANGWMCGASLYETVPAGKRTMSSFSVPSSVLEELGTTVPTAIETFLKVSVDSWDADAEVFTEDYFTIYASGYDYYDLNPVNKNLDRPLGDGEVLVEDNEYFSFVASKIEKSDWDYTMRVIVTNKADKSLYIRFSYDEGVLVNGQYTDAFLSKEIPAGKSVIEDLYWSKSTLDELGITDIETVEMPVEVCDTITYENFYEKTLTYKAE